MCPLLLLYNYIVVQVPKSFVPESAVVGAALKSVATQLLATAHAIQNREEESLSAPKTRSPDACVALAIKLVFFVDPPTVLVATIATAPTLAERPVVCV